MFCKSGQALTNTEPKAKPTTQLFGTNITRKCLRHMSYDGTLVAATVTRQSAVST